MRRSTRRHGIEGEARRAREALFAAPLMPYRPGHERHRADRTGDGRLYRRTPQAARVAGAGGDHAGHAPARRRATGRPRGALRCLGRTGRIPGGHGTPEHPHGLVHRGRTGRHSRPGAHAPARGRPRRRRLATRLLVLQHRTCGRRRARRSCLAVRSAAGVGARTGDGRAARATRRGHSAVLRSRHGPRGTHRNAQRRAALAQPLPGHGARAGRGRRGRARFAAPVRAPRGRLRTGRRTRRRIRGGVGDQRRRVPTAAASVRALDRRRRRAEAVGEAARGVPCHRHCRAGQLPVRPVLRVVPHPGQHLRSRVRREARLFRADDLRRRRGGPRVLGVLHARGSPRSSGRHFGVPIACCRTWPASSPRRR